MARGKDGGEGPEGVVDQALQGQGRRLLEMPAERKHKGIDGLFEPEGEEKDGEGELATLHSAVWGDGGGRGGRMRLTERHVLQ